MYGDHGFHCNRFGDEFNGRSLVTRQPDSVVGITRKELEIELHTLLKVGETVTRKQLDGDLKALKDDFIIDTQKILDKVEKNLNDRLKNTDDLFKTISLSKNYISVSGKRIVEVGVPVNKNDAVTKGELDKLRKTLQLVKGQVVALETKVDTNFESLETWKKNSGNTVSEIYNKVYSKAP